MLAICEGSRSRTREHFAAKFGSGDPSLYALDGTHVQDMVLGLRVKSELPDPMSVLLTVAQNRFLLNSLRGDGFLNMRLTDQETKEAVGIDPVRQVFTPCIQSEPCLLERRASGEFFCGVHHALFLPALLRGSAFWERVNEGLQLFGVPPENLTAVTGFRLDMVQRPRFTAHLYPTTATTPGTFVFLLGDAANAIHFWPGRGLNSGLASVISLARCLATNWRGTPLRDSDFMRHEAVMAMLQYRHKTRAWRQMVTTDASGDVRAIKDVIAQGMAEADQGAFDQKADINALMERLVGIRGRLEARIDGLPDDATLRDHLDAAPGAAYAYAPGERCLGHPQRRRRGGRRRVAPQTGSSRRADVAGLTPDERYLTLTSCVAQARLASVVRRGELTLHSRHSRPEEWAVRRRTSSSATSGSGARATVTKGPRDEGDCAAHQRDVHSCDRHPWPSAYRRRARRPRRRGRGPEPTGASGCEHCILHCDYAAMYANHKGWDLGQVEVECEYQTAERGSPTQLNVVLRLPDSCSEEQLNKLRVIAAKCPVHRLLEGESIFEERIELVAPVRT